MHAQGASDGQRCDTGGTGVVMDPFAVAQQLGNAPDPFALASVLAEWKPEASCRHTRGAGVSANLWDGEKFPGGFGVTQIRIPDYWTLRERSSQLFNDNLYARGLIRRLITNEINTGLKLQAEPNDELISSLSETNAEDWAENVENRFEIWAATPALCDYEGKRIFPKLQAGARREALIEGDTLVVLRHNRRTGLPKVQLIRGGRVTTPLRRPINDARKIINGVELDDRGREIAFHVRGNTFGESMRIPAFGPKSGKRFAWLEFGSDKRMDSVRGMPLLGIILQSLKELDRYRDSEQRAATINALLAMFIRKEQDKPGTNPFSAGAVRRTIVQGDADNAGAAREFNIAESIPGVVFEELQTGEVPESFNTSRPNVNYGKFETAVVQAIAWANEVPPEILTLAFSNNYSASKAAVNEFKAYITRVRSEFGSSFCQPIYIEWLTAEILGERITASGLLESKRDPLAYAEFGAWVRAVWAGPVKPSIDLGKDVRAYVEAIESGSPLISATRASEDLFGVRFKTVLKRRARELRAVRGMNDDLGISNDPPAPQPMAPGTSAANTQALVERVIEELEDYGPNPRPLN